MRTITVVGHGTASASPDTLELSVGVRVRARTATAALAEAADRQRAVVEAIRATGIGPADLRTHTISCQATTDDRGQRITGYEVSSIVEVRSPDVKGAGALIDLVVRAGGDSTVVHGLSFSIRDESELADQARDAAFDDARRKAERHAARAGVVLGAVQSLDESSVGSGTAPMFRMAAASMPVEAGETTVRESVSVVFEIS